jgi:hypothetical protein
LQLSVYKKVGKKDLVRQIVMYVSSVVYHRGGVQIWRLGSNVNTRDKVPVRRSRENRRSMGASRIGRSVCIQWGVFLSFNA